MDLINEALALSLNVTGLIGVHYLAEKRRVGWLFGIVSALLVVALNARLGIYTGVAFSLFYAGLKLRGWILWGDRD